MKTFGSILLILGIGCFVFGKIISGQVHEGEKKIQKAQKGVNTVRKISNVHPVARDVGKATTQPIQQKINKGKVEAGQYRTLSLWLKNGGVVLFVIGLILLIWGIFRRKKTQH